MSKIVTRKSPKLITTFLEKWLPLFESPCGPLLNVRKFVILTKEIGAIIDLKSLHAGEWCFSGEKLEQAFSDAGGRVFSFSANRRGEFCFEIWLGTHRISFVLEIVIGTLWRVRVMPSDNNTLEPAIAFASAHGLDVTRPVLFREPDVFDLMRQVVTALPKRTASRASRPKKR